MSNLKSDRGVGVDIDRVLDAKPAWARRAAARAKARNSVDPHRRRWALALGLVAWQANEALLPTDKVPAVRNLVVAMVVFDSVATWSWVTIGIAAEGNPVVATAMQLFGNGVGLLLRTVWTVVLVVALAWLAQRRAVVRPVLALIVAVFGAVTTIHAGILAWTIRALLAA